MSQRADRRPSERGVLYWTFIGVLCLTGTALRVLLALAILSCINWSCMGW